MRLLLDTHVIAWWAFDDAQLSERTRGFIGNAEEVWVSAVSAYEISRKYQLGKWPEAKPLVNGFESLMAAQSFSVLALSAPHAIRAGLLPASHRDPFDRLIAAQSIVEGIPVISVDQAISGLGAEVLW